MKSTLSIIFLFIVLSSLGQVNTDLSGFSKKNGTVVVKTATSLDLRWPVGGKEKGRMLINLEAGKPLIQSIEMTSGGRLREIATALDPVFVVTIGKRDLVSQNGWNIFFDRVPRKPFYA